MNAPWIRILSLTAAGMLAFAPSVHAATGKSKSAGKPAAAHTAPGSNAGDLPDPRKLSFPPLAFDPPRAEKFVLANGLTVFFLEDHEIPVVRMSVLVKCGSAYDPASKAGLSQLTGQVLRAGGSKGASGDKQDDVLAYLGASIESFIGYEFGEVSLNCLRKDAGHGLPMLADVVRNPVFDKEKEQLAKYLAVGQIRQRNEAPQSAMSTFFSKKIYGEGHPAAATMELDTLQAITREDMVAYHKKYFVPNNAWLVVAGDVSKEEVRPIVEKLFGDWKRQDVEFPKPRMAGDLVAGGTYQIHRKNSVQSVILIGHLSPLKLTDPDYPAVQVLNRILGSGFGSRMFKEVRAREGLAYSASSTVGASVRDASAFQAYAATKSSTTAQAVKKIWSEVGKIAAGDVSDDDLAYGRDAEVNSYLFRFGDSFGAARTQAVYSLFGLPDDFQLQYAEAMKKVTREDVVRVAKTYIHPEKLVTVVVGNTKEFETPLSSVGLVTEVKLPKFPKNFNNDWLRAVIWN